MNRNGLLITATIATAVLLVSIGGAALLHGMKPLAKNTEVLRFEEFIGAKGAKCAALFNPTGEAVALQCDLSGLTITPPVAEAAK